MPLEHPPLRTIGGGPAAGLAPSTGATWEEVDFVLTHQESRLGDAAHDACLVGGVLGAGVGAAQQDQGQEGDGKHGDLGGSSGSGQWPQLFSLGSYMSPPTPTGYEMLPLQGLPGPRSSPFSCPATPTSSGVQGRVLDRSTSFLLSPQPSAPFSFSPSLNCFFHPLLGTYSLFPPSSGLEKHLRDKHLSLTCHKQREAQNAMAVQ